MIDTNLLISSAIVKNSPPDKLVRLWLKRSFILLMSDEQLKEILDVSKREKLKSRQFLFSERINELLEGIEIISEVVKPLSGKDLSIRSRDPKDDYLLGTALGGKADYLITGDEDLLVLNGNLSLGNLKIITAKDFLKLI